MAPADHTRIDTASGTPGRQAVRAFCARRPVDVARALLGCRLVSTIDGATTSGLVVETEAYGGPEDPASHACTVSGVTERNRAMFGPPGTLYVYRSYGVHWCLNVVCASDGEAGAVLVRGIDPVDGLDVMRARRHGRLPLGAGPGRLSEALGVTGELYGHDLSEPPLLLVPTPPLDDVRIGVSGRIGVRRAADWPRRFYVRGAAGVSGQSTPANR
ncbi:MAG: DNA-3-methyladenine glycosylase [Gemmatimonadota bacterium]